MNTAEGRSIFAPIAVKSGIHKHDCERITYMNDNKRLYIRMTAAAVAILVLLLDFHALAPIPLLPLTAMAAKSVRSACISAAAVL